MLVGNGPCLHCSQHGVHNLCSWMFADIQLMQFGLPRMRAMAVCMWHISVITRVSVTAIVSSTA